VQCQSNIFEVKKRQQAVLAKNITYIKIKYSKGVQGHVKLVSLTDPFLNTQIYTDDFNKASSMKEKRIV